MGTRIAALAGASGIDTVLAGRPASELAAAAGRLGLPWRSAELTDPDALDAMLANVQIVLNTAGPFARTAPALMRACLRNRCHYLDLSNEASTFEDAWSLDEAARKAGASIVPGAGFGTAVVETLATHVLGRLREPQTLTIVRTSEQDGRTRGVNRTMLEILAQPGAGIIEGRWQGRGLKITGFDLPGGRRAGIPVGLGDAYATAKATGLRHVAAYATIQMNLPLARIGIPIIRRLIRAGRSLPHGPARGGRRKATAPGPESVELWIQAANAHGQSATSYVQVANADELAVQIALQAVQSLRSHTAPGALTAGALIGAPTVLKLTGIQITDL